VRKLSLHKSPLAREASDHLPLVAELEIEVAPDGAAAAALPHKAAQGLPG